MIPPAGLLAAMHRAISPAMMAGCRSETLKTASGSAALYRLGIERSRFAAFKGSDYMKRS